MKEKRKYLVTKEVAELLRVNPVTLSNWRNIDRKGPPFVKIGSNVLYPQDQLYDWLDKNTISFGAKS